eukprot:746011-Hanusia_phi.AAC.3
MVQQTVEKVYSNDKRKFDDICDEVTCGGGRTAMCQHRADAGEDSELSSCHRSPLFTSCTTRSERERWSEFSEGHDNHVRTSSHQKFSFS